MFQKTLTGGRYNESNYPVQELWWKRGGGRIFEGGVLAGHYGTKHRQLQTLPFVLTNAVVWSFGLAERTAGNRFKVTKQFDLLTNHDKPELCYCLQYVVRGQWPN